MSQHTVSITLLFVLTRVACADVVVDLRPDAPAPYDPGQVVNVEVYFVDDGTGHPITGDDIEFRLYRLDFTDTDVTLAPASDMVMTNFTGVNSVRPALPRPSLFYPIHNYIPGLLQRLPAGGEMLVGSIDVMINGAGWLDVLNADDEDTSHGALMFFGFGNEDDDPEVTWRAYTGEITGGALFLPEPGVLTLLAVGGLVVMRRRLAERG